MEAVRQLAAASGSLMEIGRRGLPERLPVLGIERLLEGRLGRVPAEVQPFLRLAAVAGRRLELPVLAESWQRIEEMLQVGADAGVLELHEEQWRFSHDKLREWLLQRMSSEERARLHRRVAESLESVHAGSPLKSTQVAHHFHQAGELSQAAHYYCLAGQSALTRGATVEAVSAFEQALALQRPGASSQLEQVKAWRGLSQAHYGLGRLSEAAAALQKVCEVAGQPLPASGIEHLWAFGCEVGATLARLTHADKILPRPPLSQEQRALSREVLEALSVLEGFIWQGQPMRVMLTSLRGLNLHGQLKDESLPRAVFRSCIATLFSFTFLGGLALHYIERTETPQRDEAAWGILLLRSKAVVALNSGRWTEALQHAERALELARKHERWLLHTLQQLMVALCDVDEFGRALQVGRELEALALRTQSSLFVALAYLGQGGAHLRFGHAEEAEELFAKARESGAAGFGPVPAAVLHGLSALCAVQAGRLDVARERADLALVSVRSAGWPLAQLRYALIGILFAYLAEGRESLPPNTAEALALLHRTARMFRVVLPAALLYHGLHDFRRGRLRSAHARWKRGLAAARQYRLRYEEGWTHYWLGRLAQTRLGGWRFREDAAAHFTAARAIFTRLGAAWDAAQVDSASSAGACPHDLASRVSATGSFSASS